MEDPLFLQKINSASAILEQSFPQTRQSLLFNNNYILKYYLDTMNACNPQEPLSEAQIALNIKHYEYSQKFGANYLNRFESNMRECHENRFYRQNEMNQQLKHSGRCLNNIGPPPRPFKKARYAWEIKNYDYTVRRMSQPSEEDSSLQGTSQENRRAQEDRTIDINSTLIENQDNSSNNNEEISSISVNDCRPEYMAPVIPAGYPPHFGNFPGHDLSQKTSLLAQGFIQNEIHQQICQSRQLSKSIFQNTVNHMLENMGFSPVTEASQGLHPLLVANLSDDAEREAEEAHQRALETQALSAALHQKGLLAPKYLPTPDGSATTSDYDSSEEEEEESELGDIGGSEDLACEAPQTICTGTDDPYTGLTYCPTSIPLGIPMPLAGSVSDKQNHSDLSTCDMICPSAQNPCDFQKDCDSNLISQPQREQNYDIHECSHDTPTAQLKLDDNENCISKSETLIEGKVERVLDDGNPKVNDSENNNNDKFFIRNAIEMAIKQHGLGFQKA